MLVVTAGCTLPARTATLEGEQRRLHEEVAALRAKVAALEERLATMSKRLGAAAAQRTREQQRQKATEEHVGAAVSERDEGAVRSPEATPSPAVASTPAELVVLPALDLERLGRESARQLPGGYRRGIELLRGGDYERAIQTLREFAGTKHTSPFVPGAHYWIGQAYLQLGQFYPAILAFTDVQHRGSRSEFAPAAGFASGLAFRQLGNLTEARRAFERVAADYPGTPEATRATAELRLLGRDTR
jgi:tol-pal system protein YbgF